MQSHQDEAEQEGVYMSVPTRVVLNSSGRPSASSKGGEAQTARNSIKQRREAKQAGRHCGEKKEFSRVGREKRRKPLPLASSCVPSAVTSMSCRRPPHVAQKIAMAIGCLALSLQARMSFCSAASNNVRLAS
jgi:hypothetical protein